MPEAYRANPSISRYDSMESLLKGTDGYAKHFGVPADQILRMPPKDATPEAMAEFYGKLGRPETPDAYAFNGIDLANEGDKAFVEGFRADAHKLGFTQSQMDGIMTYLGTSIGTVDAQIEGQIVENRKAARADFEAWAGADKAKIYDNEIPTVVERLGLKAGLITKNEDGSVNADSKEGLIKALNVGGEADNPALLRLFAVMADMTAEGGALPGVGKSEIAGNMTVAEAQAAKTTFLNNAEMQAALHNAQDPKHGEALAERNRLNAIIAKGA